MPQKDPQPAGPPLVTAPKTIGLGLDEDLGRHVVTGAVTYLDGGWQRAGLTTVDPARMGEQTSFRKAFNEAAQNASSIRFDVTNFDPKYANPNFTSWEFEQITTRPELLNKTTFIKNGQEHTWNGREFVKKP